MDGCLLKFQTKTAEHSINFGTDVQGSMEEHVTYIKLDIVHPQKVRFHEDSKFNVIYFTR